MSQFDVDLERGHKAELLVRDILAGLTDEISFEWVGNDPECYHKGDIKALAADRVYYIEVKDDTVIATTGNILCEERVYNKNTGGEKKGFMYSDYDIYCVAS